MGGGRGGERRKEGRKEIDGRERKGRQNESVLLCVRDCVDNYVVIVRFPFFINMHPPFEEDFIIIEITDKLKFLTAFIAKI